MIAPIVVNARVTVPVFAQEAEALRSSGPGGQNVNKVASKVRLRIALDRIEGLAPGELERLRSRLASRLDAGGRLVVSAQSSRDQARNAEEAAVRAAELIGAALHVDRPRRPTRPTRASRDRRRERKRRRSKRLREREIPREE